jgi:hypothetical protein
MKKVKNGDNLHHMTLREYLSCLLHCLSTQLDTLQLTHHMVLVSLVKTEFPEAEGRGGHFVSVDMNRNAVQGEEGCYNARIRSSPIYRMGEKNGYETFTRSRSKSVSFSAASDSDVTDKTAI